MKQATSTVNAKQLKGPRNRIKLSVMGEFQADDTVIDFLAAEYLAWLNE